MHLQDVGMKLKNMLANNVFIQHTIIFSSDIFLRRIRMYKAIVVEFDKITQWKYHGSGNSSNALLSG